jgi:hypothetical protein
MSPAKSMPGMNGGLVPPSRSACLPVPSNVSLGLTAAARTAHEGVQGVWRRDRDAHHAKDLRGTEAGQADGAVRSPPA